MPKFRVGRHNMRNGLQATIHEVRSDGCLLGILSLKTETGQIVRLPGVWQSDGNMLRVCVIPNPEHPEEQGIVRDYSLFDLLAEQHTLWINVFKTDTGYLTNAYTGKAEADSVASSSRIACININIREGDGL